MPREGGAEEAAEAGVEEAPAQGVFLAGGLMPTTGAERAGKAFASALVRARACAGVGEADEAACSTRCQMAVLPPPRWLRGLRLLRLRDEVGRAVVGMPLAVGLRGVSEGNWVCCFHRSPVSHSAHLLR